MQCTQKYSARRAVQKKRLLVLLKSSKLFVLGSQPAVVVFCFVCSVLSVASGRTAGWGVGASRM